jgi:hypothetical protein
LLILLHLYICLKYNDRITTNFYFMWFIIFNLYTNLGIFEQPRVKVNKQGKTTTGTEL